uniref:Uncharacterized protein n=1 Tax=Leersia perrieri TaxID=77586 RepID=A0A0D9XUK4_9ORYZ
MDPSKGTSEGQILVPAIDPSNQSKDMNDEGKAAIVEKKKKKTKMVRYTREQINYCIANPEELSDAKDYRRLTEPRIRHGKNFGRAEGYKKKLKDDFRHEREVIFGIPDKAEDVLKKFYSKGYAEYEVVVDDDEDNVPARVAAPSGRRRFRNGVAVKKNQSGGSSIRKI